MCDSPLWMKCCKVQAWSSTTANKTRAKGSPPQGLCWELTDAFLTWSITSRMIIGDAILHISATRRRRPAIQNFLEPREGNRKQKTSFEILSKLAMITACYRVANNNKASYYTSWRYCELTTIFEMTSTRYRWNTIMKRWTTSYSSTGCEISRWVTRSHGALKSTHDESRDAWLHSGYNDLQVHSWYTSFHWYMMLYEVGQDTYQKNREWRAVVIDGRPRLTVCSHASFKRSESVAAVSSEGRMRVSSRCNCSPRRLCSVWKIYNVISITCVTRNCMTIYVVWQRSHDLSILSYKPPTLIMSRCSNCTFSSTPSIHENNNSEVQCFCRREHDPLALGCGNVSNEPYADGSLTVGKSGCTSPSPDGTLLPFTSPSMISCENSFCVGMTDQSIKDATAKCQATLWTVSRMCICVQV